MILDATTRKVQALLAGAAATTNPTVTVDWVDLTTTTTVPGCTVSNLNGTTAVDICAAPAASTQRKVNGITINNVDTAAVVCTVRYNDNATLYTMVKITLSVGDVLNFTDTKGWFVVDAAGNTKTSGSGGVGRFLKTTVLTSGTSFTTQPTTTGIFVRVQAGGGGGGGTTTVAVSAAVGGGGAAGGYAEKTFAVTGNTAYAYTIGALGAKGAATGATGSAGGNSTWVGSVTVTALGGPGGIGEAAGTALAVVLGGAAPAISTNGDLNGSGDPGSPGIRLSGLIGGSGKGGSSAFGAGGNGVNAQGAGVAATAPGAGGSGGCTLNGGAAVTGGDGTAGVIVVDEYT